MFLWYIRNYKIVNKKILKVESKVYGHDIVILIACAATEPKALKTKKKTTYFLGQTIILLFIEVILNKKSLYIQVIE